jgi:hypothetical protein
MPYTHIANPVRVSATRILEVTDITPRIEGCGQSSPDLMLRLEDGRNYPTTCAMTARHIPVPGDYLVRQEDGYEYLNPKAVFERKYSVLATADHVHAISFDDFIEYGRQRASDCLFDGMPWAFTYEGHPVTHETNSCYLVGAGKCVRFTPGHVLIVDADGALSVLPAHQHRVILEKTELDESLKKLAAFLATKTFAYLDGAEQDRLRAQADAMGVLSEILRQRIAAF